MNSTNIKPFIILVVCSMFFWNMGFQVGNVALPLTPFLIIFSLIIFCIAKPKTFFKTVILAYKKTPIKYLILFVAWAVFSPLIFGHLLRFPYILFRVTRAFIIFAMPAVFFSIYYIPKFLKFRTLAKLFIFIYYFILVYGIINYIGRLYDISFFMTIQNNIISGLGAAEKAVNNITNMQIIPSSIIRATSIFFEPSFFATYLFLFLPFTYMFFTSRIRMIKHKNFDILFKFSLLVLTWINILITKSPIYLILCLIYTLVYFRNYILKLFLNRLFGIILLFISVFAGLIFLSGTQNFEEITSSYQWSRINKVFNSFSDIETLIESEPSLGARIVLSTNALIASKVYPIAGTGYGNAMEAMHAQLNQSPLPLTEEIIYKCFILGKADGVPSNIFFSILIHTGYIGVLLLYLFFIRSIYLAGKIKKYFPPREAIFLSAIQLICINYIIISFYWSLTRDISMWFIFGILNSYILTYKLNLQKQLHLQKIQLKERKEEV